MTNSAEPEKLRQAYINSRPEPLLNITGEEYHSLLEEYYEALAPQSRYLEPISEFSTRSMATVITPHHRMPRPPHITAESQELMRLALEQLKH